MTLEPTTTTYVVSGMTCGHCVAAVTEEITSLAGVRTVVVDLVEGGDSPVHVTSDSPARPRAGPLGGGRGRLRPRGRLAMTEDGQPSEVELTVGGMTCASCAARVEKKLNRMPGVEASVNYATERAHVVLPAGVSAQDAIATVEATGYTASLPAPSPVGDRRGAEPEELTDLRRRLIGLGRAHGAGRAALDDPGSPVRPLAVGGARARHAGGRLGRLALPPRCLGQPASRRHLDGHADQHRRARGVRLVGLRPVLRGRRHDRDAHGGRPRPPTRRNGRLAPLPGGSERDHGPHPARPLPRGPCPTTFRRGTQGPARAGRARRRRAARRCRDQGPRRPAARG